MKAKPKSCHCHTCRHLDNKDTRRYFQHLADKRVRREAKRALSLYEGGMQLLILPASYSAFR